MGFSMAHRVFSSPLPIFLGSWKSFLHPRINSFEFSENQEKQDRDDY